MRHSHHPPSHAMILLVENDESLGNVLREAFQDEGYEVRLAAHAPSAAEVADLRPDLMMLDVERNEAEAGWELVRELKATRPTAHLPIVVTSGDGAIVAQEDVRVCAEAAAILVKPYSLDDLLPVVATALDRRGTHRAVRELLAEPLGSEPFGCIGF
jgi:DNA-binding response OmpR family regulator